MPSMPTEISFDIIDDILGDAPKKVSLPFFFWSPNSFCMVAGRCNLVGKGNFTVFFFWIVGKNPLRRTYFFFCQKLLLSSRNWDKVANEVEASAAVHCSLFRERERNHQYCRREEAFLSAIYLDQEVFFSFVVGGIRRSSLQPNFGFSRDVCYAWKEGREDRKNGLKEERKSMSVFPLSGRACKFT